MADGSIIIDIDADSEGLEKELNGVKSAAQSSAGAMSKGFTVAKGVLANLVSSGISMVVSGLADMAKEAVSAADSMKKFESTMSFAGFSHAEISATSAAVKEYASRTVYDLETVLNTTAQLGANGVANFEQLTEAAGNLNAVAGGNADTFRSVAMMLTQTAGAGKLTTENWNQLADAIPGASGKLQEAMRQNGAYTGNFREAMEKGEITAEAFNQAIMDLGMTEVAQEAAASTATIEGAVGNLKATIVDGLTGALTDGGGLAAITGFINGITTVVQGAGAMLGPVFAGLQETFARVSEAIDRAFSPEQQAAIASFFQTIGSAILTAPFALLAGLVNAAATAFELLVSAAGAVAGFFTSVLPGAIQATVGWFQQLPGNISSAVSSAASAVSAWASNTVSTMSRAASSAVSAVVNFFSQLPGRISGFLSGVISAMASWAANMAAKAREAGSNVVSAVSSFLSQLPGRVASLLAGALSALIAWGGQMVSQARAKMQQVGTAITSALRGLPGQMLSIGSNIMQGLLNGIKNKVGAILSTIGNVAGQIKGKFMGLLGIHSPSRVFKKYGEYIVQGLSDGIESASQLAVRKVEWLARDLIDLAGRLNDALVAKEEELTKRLENTGLDEATREALTNQLNVAREFRSEYEKALQEIQKSQESMANKLKGYGDLFTEIKNGTGSFLELSDLEAQISGIKRYGDALEQLKSRGASDSLLDEITGMSVDDATAYTEQLLSMTEDQYSQYMALWEQKQAAAQQIAARFYKDELNALGKEFVDKIPEELSDVKEEMRDIGVQGVRGMISGLYSQSGALASAMTSIVNSALAAARAAADIHSPSRKAASLVGVPLAQGVGVGFEKAYPGVMERVKTAFDASMAQTSARLQGAAGGRGGGGSTREVTNTTTTVDRVLRIEVTGSDGEFVRWLRKKLKAEDDRVGPSLA